MDRKELCKLRYIETKKSGLCHRCGKLKEHNTQYVNCYKCRVLMSDYIKKRYRNAKNKNLCVLCGADSLGSAHCDKCKIKLLERIKKRIANEE